MAADLDNRSDLTNEDIEPAADGHRSDKRKRGTVGTILAVLVAALIVIIILTQCTARVPDVVGLDRNAAQSRLKRSGLKLGDVSEIVLPTTREGLVAEQTPVAGVMLRTGAAVDLLISRSTHLVTVPDVRGQDSANASVELQQAGFDPQPADEYSDTVAMGIAIWQSPAGGQRAPSGSAVTVYYSLGPQSAADTSVTPSSTSGGYGQSPGSTGSATDDTPIFSTARAYPGARAWSSGGDIYVRLTPGSGARRVTSGSPWDTHPVISPSHRYLVFMRAPSSGARSTAIGAVSLTGFVTRTLTAPKIDVSHYAGRWVGPPVFAPSPNSRRVDSDWIVYPHYFTDWKHDASGVAPRLQPSAQLLICKVPYDTTWISWNEQFRPARTLTLSASSRAGCVRVRQFIGGQKLYDRALYLPTGAYLR